jgi:fluoride exporter
MLYVVVALGAAIGGVLRALVSLGTAAVMGSGFLWATLIANVSGSFAIGLYAALTSPGGRVLAGPRQRQFIMTGILGGFTTFSIFSLETLRLLHANDIPSAGLNVGVSVAAWLTAVTLGYSAGLRLNGRHE